VGISDVKRSLRRPRHRWKDNIEMDFQVGWGSDWSDLAQDRDRWWALVNAENFLIS
jgi:hypothetical protein